MMKAGYVWKFILPNSAPVPTPAKMGWDSLIIKTVGIHPTYTLPTPTQNSSLNLSVTCSYFAHNLFVTFSWLVHYLMFVTCSWFANYLFMTCSLRFHDLFTISSLLIHNFFITCSIFFLQLIQDFYATLTQFLLLYDLFGTCSFKYYFFMTYS